MTGHGSLAVEEKKRNTMKPTKKLNSVRTASGIREVTHEEEVNVTELNTTRTSLVEISPAA